MIPSTTIDVPKLVLLNFFHSATSALEKCSVEYPQALSFLRMIVLDEQKRCLDQVVKDFNFQKLDVDPTLTIDIVQESLKGLSLLNDCLEDDVKIAMDRMNDCARLALTRLVLQSECLKVSNESSEYENLNRSDPMSRTDILEFCGLCTIAVQLPNVHRHLLHGIPLFDCDGKILLNRKDDSSSQFPEQRLHAIQRLILRALGYEPDHGTNEIKRIFYSSTGNSEFSGDSELLDIFATMESAMNVILTNATLYVTQNSLFSDREEGGVTRIVSVNYSEKLIDASSGLELPLEEGFSTASDIAPTSQIMENTQTDKERKLDELRIARDASRLQQEILGELLSMRDEERETKLQLAKEEADKFVRNVMQIPAGSDRIMYMQTMDAQTQKLLAMHKLWESMLAANNGKPPTMRFNCPE
jgi:hypothetical protein